MKSICWSYEFNCNSLNKIKIKCFFKVESHQNFPRIFCFFRWIENKDAPVIPLYNFTWDLFHNDGKRVQYSPEQMGGDAVLNVGRKSIISFRHLHIHSEHISFESVSLSCSCNPPLLLIFCSEWMSESYGDIWDNESLFPYSHLIQGVLTTQKTIPLLIFSSPLQVSSSFWNISISEWFQLKLPSQLIRSHWSVFCCQGNYFDII